MNRMQAEQLLKKIVKAKPCCTNYFMKSLVDVTTWSTDTVSDVVNTAYLDMNFSGATITACKVLLISFINYCKYCPNLLPASDTRTDLIIDQFLDIQISTSSLTDDVYPNEVPPLIAQFHDRKYMGSLQTMTAVQGLTHTPAKVI